MKSKTITSCLLDKLQLLTFNIFLKRALITCIHFSSVLFCLLVTSCQKENELKLKLTPLTNVSPSAMLSSYDNSWDYATSVTADFVERDKLSEFSKFCYNHGWGPYPRQYPKPVIPRGCNIVRWKQKRIIAVAKKYLGLPYKHHHIPHYNPKEGEGLDCSNFTSWVYNYGLGILISSNVKTQSRTAGRLLKKGEFLAPGDLLYIRPWHDEKISHVVIFIDKDHIIDEPDGGVDLRPFKGWYKARFAFARRIILA